MLSGCLRAGPVGPQRVRCVTLAASFGRPLALWETVVPRRPVAWNVSGDAGGPGRVYPSSSPACPFPQYPSRTIAYGLLTGGAGDDAEVDYEESMRAQSGWSGHLHLVPTDNPCRGATRFRFWQFYCPFAKAFCPSSQRGL